MGINYATPLNVWQELTEPSKQAEQVYAITVLLRQGQDEVGQRGYLGCKVLCVCPESQVYASSEWKSEWRFVISSGQDRRISSYIPRSSGIDLIYEYFIF